jgi:hypothetical protein
MIEAQAQELQQLKRKLAQLQEEKATTYELHSIRQNKKEFSTFALEMMRRITLEGHISNKRLMVTMALQFTAMTGEVPTEEEMVSVLAAKRAFTKLGAHDDWMEGLSNKADPHGWGLSSDGASKKRPHGLKHMHLAAMSRYNSHFASPPDISHPLPPH